MWCCEAGWLCGSCQNNHDAHIRRVKCKKQHIGEINELWLIRFISGVHPVTLWLNIFYGFLLSRILLKQVQLTHLNADIHTWGTKIKKKDNIPDRSPSKRQQVPFHCRNGPLQEPFRALIESLPQGRSSHRPRKTPGWGWRLTRCWLVQPGGGCDAEPSRRRAPLLVPRIHRGEPEQQG